MHSSAACFVTQCHISEVCLSLFTYSIINGVSIFFNILLLQTVLLRAFLYISPLSKSRNFSGPQLLDCRVCTFSVLQNSVFMVLIYPLTNSILKVLIILQP